MKKVTKVHFVGLILGRMYGAAEFNDGLVRHYWLQETKDWQPNTVYQPGDLVQPTTHNGFYYKANTQSQAPKWAPEQAKAIGDVVQPTTPNGWEYVFKDVPRTPSTGSSEPAWPTEEGAQVFEGTDSTTVPSAPVDSDAAVKEAYDQLIKDRYNLGDDA